MTIHISPASEHVGPEVWAGGVPVGERGRRLTERPPAASAGSAFARASFIPFKAVDPRKIHRNVSSPFLQQRSKLAQAAIDVIAVAFGVFFASVTALSIVASIFLLLFARF